MRPPMIRLTTFEKITLEKWHKIVYIFVQKEGGMYSKIILKKIQSFPEGEPFVANMFLEIAPYTAIRHTLSRLVKSGHLMRAARGVYVRPKMNRFVGPIPPSSENIVRLKSEGEMIGITGAEAVQRLGLSTQVVLKEIFLTSGRSRKIRLENGREILLRHAAPRKLMLAGRPAGVALTALWYLGKNGVTTETIHQIHKRLPPEEFEILKNETHLMPSWMREKLLNSGEEVACGR